MNGEASKIRATKIGLNGKYDRILISELLNLRRKRSNSTRNAGPENEFRILSLRIDNDKQRESNEREVTAKLS